MPEILALADTASTESVSFPLCAFGAAAQKITTFMSTPRLAALFRPLGSLRCTHVKHEKQVGGSQVDGTWTSAAHAAYPADLNLYVARVLASLIIPVSESDSDGPINAPATARRPEPAGEPNAAPDNEEVSPDEPEDAPLVRPSPLPDGLPPRSRMPSTPRRPNQSPQHRTYLPPRRRCPSLSC